MHTFGGTENRECHRRERAKHSQGISAETGRLWKDGESEGEGGKDRIRENIFLVRNHREEGGEATVTVYGASMECTVKGGVKAPCLVGTVTSPSLSHDHREEGGEATVP
jgi:hypothetical protein